RAHAHAGEPHPARPGNLPRALARALRRRSRDRRRLQLPLRAMSEIPLWFTVAGVAARWIHLVACVLFVGTFTHLLTGGPSDRPPARACEARRLGWARALVVLGLVTGVLALQSQTATLVGTPRAAFDLAALTRVLLDTHGGRVWLARHALLLLLAAFVF